MSDVLCSCYVLYVDVTCDVLLCTYYMVYVLQNRNLLEISFILGQARFKL